METDHRTEFSRRYADCHEDFTRYCSALCFGRMDVEDLMQDVLLSAYQHFGKLRDRDKLLHYLIRAARLRAISLRRKRGRNAVLAETQADRLRAKGASPDDLLDVQILYRALDELPARQREALILFEISGYSMREIANVQGRSEASVKMQVSRGRKRLADLLDDSKTNGHALPHFFLAAKLLLL